MAQRQKGAHGPTDDIFLENNIFWKSMENSKLKKKVQKEPKILKNYQKISICPWAPNLIRRLCFGDRFIE